MKFILCLFVSILTIIPLQKKSLDKLIDPDKITFTILYNEVSAHDSIIPDQGFSCLVEMPGYSILFDAGRIEEYLENNSRKMRINYHMVDFIFISHLHGDHVGGLPSIAEKCNQPVLYLPQSFPKNQTEKGREYAADKLKKAEPHVSKIININAALKIDSSCFSTGPIENQTYEQALILNTLKGLIILVGCAHPGIVEIVKWAKALLNKEVYFIMGGFHLAITDQEEVRDIAYELRSSTKFIAPCHCTGEESIQIFKDVFKDDYMEVKAGHSFIINDNG